ncbi:MAG TPA: glycosyltransferase family 4 protein [Alphaproteobacteria bacterium]|jgi:UDP-N-acetylmuramyl pentapeptide phosphotransferase/UDP-N-acetylglucosamine-1-phosphate transferase
MPAAFASPALAAGLFVVCAVASWIATRIVLSWLERRAILDRPNERSSHTRPTPRGGGLAVSAVVIVAGGAFASATDAPLAAWILLAGMLALALLSWLDDLRDLSAAVRLLTHAVVVAAALSAMPADATVFQGWLPPLLDRVVAGLLWIWFINLFNFMDGIDGITGVETMTVGLGLFVLSLLAPLGAIVLAGHMGLVAAGAALGFLLWNWHPARIFLGDVGSVPLGFLLGGLLLGTAAAGQWAAALILPLYYLADATITLSRRALRREKIWQAHREHFYQAAVIHGWRHDKTSLCILAANAALLLLAVLSVEHPAPALAGAVLVVAVLLATFVRAGRAQGRGRT